MSKRPKDNTVGPWAADKLDALGRGLDYYTTRLKKQPQWRKIFIDAFAGPGLSRVRTRPQDNTTGDLFSETDSEPVAQEAMYLEGSPRVALAITNPFDEYVFVEKDIERVAELELLRSEYGTTRNIEIVQGDANAVLLDRLKSITRQRHRAYIFLDPFGLHVPWATIEAIAKTRAIEVMINFPLSMALRRMMPNSGDLPPSWLASLNTFFGTSDWEGLVYAQRDDLFGVGREKIPGSEERLLAWYRERLGAAFNFVSEAKLVTNTREQPLYYLIWAGPRKEGLAGADYILRMKRQRSRRGR